MEATMDQQMMESTSMVPGKPLRVLIEAPDLAGASALPRRLSGIEVAVCSGPHDETKPCPLVVDGACPFGDCDIVVSALDGPWAEPVRRAWAAANVVLTTGSGHMSASTEDAFDTYLGAGLLALYRAQYFADADP